MQRRGRLGVIHGGEDVRLLGGEAARVALEERDVVGEEALGGDGALLRERVAHDRVQREAAGPWLLDEPPAPQRREGAARRLRDGGDRAGVHVVARAAREHDQRATARGRQACPGPLDEETHLDDVVLVGHHAHALDALGDEPRPERLGRLAPVVTSASAMSSASRFQRSQAREGAHRREGVAARVHERRDDRKDRHARQEAAASP